MRAARTGVDMRAETDVHLEVGTSSRSSLRVAETLVRLKVGTLSDGHLTAAETSVHFIIETSSGGHSIAEQVVHFLVGTSYCWQMRMWALVHSGAGITVHLRSGTAPVGHSASKGSIAGTTVEGGVPNHEVGEDHCEGTVLENAVFNQDDTRRRCASPG